MGYAFGAVSLELFPLYCCRRFRGDVIHYAVDAAHLVYDVVRYACEEVVRKVYPVGSHAVGRGNGP